MISKGIKFGSFLLLAYILVLIFKCLSITYTYNIHGVIDNTPYHHTMLWLVDNIADSNDTVVMDINSPGGSAHLTIRIINSVLATDAHTICHNRAIAYSGAALISLACKEGRRDKYTALMFHRAYYMSGGVKILAKVGQPEHDLIQGYIELRLFPLITKYQQAIYNSGGNLYMSAIKE